MSDKALYWTGWDLGSETSISFKYLSPESFGWVRRSEYDQNGGKAYEAPDGRIKIFPPGMRPQLTKVIATE